MLGRRTLTCWNILIVFLVPFIYTIDSLATIKDRITKLHSLTKFSTFYEMFDLKENASESSVKKAYRRLRKLKPFNNLSQKDYDYLLSSGYNILIDMREAYQSVLNQSKYIYIDDSKNYKNYYYVLIVVSIAFIILLDAMVFGFRYLNYFETKAEDRGKKGKDTGKSVDPPVMYITKLWRMIKGN